ncbi:hypothetical protein T310_2777 [Rasamsonia emersonii CBS 393.64]|uniref:Deoxyribonuclease NucA/NucB domain-containing protein n=1 Tax=Rasamsonia emersonii (strain ATCC 16479 / CBS 393.64 / IMI 116815) TaxID=1408163 RepID=A0A0F4YY83_RASE3|nr:hypothetical protein T310_2777 [Rasamsonia emersonii CBS 393.64]KKA23184.1 hypothetical protein T310_2777 [Rasamsonia emersonii CBS 393.64]
MRFSTLVPLLALTLTGLDMLVHATPNHILNWDCSDRMQGTSLEWDKPSDSTKQARSNAAGCGNNNRCSKAPYGSTFECDEFPYKSTKNADHNVAVNRCVPKDQNRRQGALLKNFYYSQGRFSSVGLGGRPGHFQISFSNVGHLQYCKSATGTPDCTNDGNEYDRNGKAHDKKKRDDADSNDGTQDPPNHYLLSDGRDIYVPGGAEIGDHVWTPRARNASLFDEMLDADEPDDSQGLEQYDYMLHNLYLENATIVAVIP